MFDEIVHLTDLQLGVSHSVRTRLEVYVALVRRIGYQFVIVHHHAELVCIDATEHAGSHREAYLDALRECAQHLAFRHVHGLDGHLDALLGKDVGEQTDADCVRHNLDALYLLQLHGAYDGVAEVGDVDGHGLDEAE